jgi:hypothetical protein
MLFFFDFFGSELAQTASASMALLLEGDRELGKNDL